PPTRRSSDLERRRHTKRAREEIAGDSPREPDRYRLHGLSTRVGMVCGGPLEHALAIEQCAAYGNIMSEWCAVAINDAMFAISGCDRGTSGREVGHIVASFFSWPARN